MQLTHHGRYDYSALPHREDFSWPDGKRLAIYLGMNLECFSFGEGLGAELAPGGPQPDVLNYAWRDYGNRAGAWRMLELFDRLDLPCTVLANSHLYDHAPGLIEAMQRVVMRSRATDAPTPNAKATYPSKTKPR